MALVMRSSVRTLDPYRDWFLPSESAPRFSRYTARSPLELHGGPNFRQFADAPRDDFPVTVQRDLPRPVLFAKIFRLRRRANQKYNHRRLIPPRGDVGHRHERWDGMRWTRQRRARLGLQGGSSVSDRSAQDERC